MALACAMIAPAAAAATHTVVVEGMTFRPATLHARAGDRIVFVNHDPFAHTATADGVFDSGEIAADASWTLVVQKRGSFAYRCTLHPTMRATLVVE